MRDFQLLKERGKNMSTFIHKQKRLKCVPCKMYLLKTQQVINFKLNGPNPAAAEAVTAS